MPEETLEGWMARRRELGKKYTGAEVDALILLLLAASFDGEAAFRPWLRAIASLRVPHGVRVLAAAWPKLDVGLRNQVLRWDWEEFARDQRAAGSVALAARVGPEDPDSASELLRRITNESRANQKVSDAVVRELRRSWLDDHADGGPALLRWHAGHLAPRVRRPLLQLLIQAAMLEDPHRPGRQREAMATAERWLARLAEELGGDEAALAEIREVRALSSRPQPRPRPGQDQAALTQSTARAPEPNSHPAGPRPGGSGETSAVSPIAPTSEPGRGDAASPEAAEEGGAAAPVATTSAAALEACARELEARARSDARLRAQIDHATRLAARERSARERLADSARDQEAEVARLRNLLLGATAAADAERARAEAAAASADAEAAALRAELQASRRSLEDERAECGSLRALVAASPSRMEAELANARRVFAEQVSHAIGVEVSNIRLLQRTPPQELDPSFLLNVVATLLQRLSGAGIEVEP